MNAVDRTKPLNINCWILYGAMPDCSPGNPGATDRPDKLHIDLKIEVATELDGWKIAKRLLSFSNYRNYVFWVAPCCIGFTTAERWLNNAGYGYDEKTAKYKAKKHLGHTEEYFETPSDETNDGLPDRDSFIAGPDFVDPRHGGQGKKFPGVKTRWPFQKKWNKTEKYTCYRDFIEEFYKKNPTARRPSWVHPEWKNYPFDEADPNRP